MISLEDFKNEPQGKRFSDVLKDNRIDFQDVINFFNKPEITRRMEDSELHHERTPFAGIVKEFERLDSVASFLGGYDGHTTQRFRQAIGALIRIHMEALGWKTTGRKGSLGVRAKVKPGTSTPDTYYNKSGLSRWFTKSERYEKIG